MGFTGIDTTAWVVRVVGMNHLSTGLSSEAIYGPFASPELAAGWLAANRARLAPVLAPQVMPLTAPSPAEVAP